MLAALLSAACSNPDVLYVGAANPSDPLAVPLVWQEHWYEHNQRLTLVGWDEDVAIYYDQDVDRAQAAWLFSYASAIWRYTVAAYGALGPGRLYVILHQGRYLGCHSDTHFSAVHDGRNVIDCGFSQAAPPSDVNVLVPHMAALIVESTARGRDGAPARNLWQVSKWAEFYRYDLYRGIGSSSDADSVYALWTGDGYTDSFPRAGTHWFRDWFYPLWRDHGGAQVMNRFFTLLARDFPAQGERYARDMNWGEFVHFMSGAAAVDLKAMATAAFGWPSEWEAQLAAARADFPGITY